MSRAKGNEMDGNISAILKASIKGQKELENNLIKADLYFPKKHKPTHINTFVFEGYLIRKRNIQEKKDHASIERRNKKRKNSIITGATGTLVAGAYALIHTFNPELAQTITSFVQDHLPIFTGGAAGALAGSVYTLFDPSHKPAVEEEALSRPQQFRESAHSIIQRTEDHCSGIDNMVNHALQCQATKLTRKEQKRIRKAKKRFKRDKTYDDRYYNAIIEFGLYIDKFMNEKNGWWPTLEQITFMDEQISDFRSFIESDDPSILKDEKHPTISKNRNYDDYVKDINTPASNVWMHTSQDNWREQYSEKRIPGSQDRRRIIETVIDKDGKDHTKVKKDDIIAGTERKITRRKMVYASTTHRFYYSKIAADELAKALAKFNNVQTPWTPQDIPEKKRWQEIGERYRQQQRVENDLAQQELRFLDSRKHSKNLEITHHTKKLKTPYDCQPAKNIELTTNTYLTYTNKLYEDTQKARDKIRERKIALKSLFEAINENDMEMMSCAYNQLNKKNRSTCMLPSWLAIPLGAVLGAGTGAIIQYWEVINNAW